VDVLITDYEISRNTLAIIPIDEFTCHIIEEDNSFIVSKSSSEVIDDSCKFFGSSLSGRLEGTKNLLGNNYKNPVIIEETREIIFFPTSSLRENKCVWISLNNLEKYVKNDTHTKVYFKNGKSVDVAVSYGSLENQILRSTRLESILRKRKSL
jgi:competence protein ComK